MGKGTWGKTGVRKDQRKDQSCKRSKSATGNQPILCLKGAFQVWLFASSLFSISILINSHFQLVFWVFGLLVSVDIIGHSFVCGTLGMHALFQIYFGRFLLLLKISDVLFLPITWYIKTMLLFVEILGMFSLYHSVLRY